MILCKQLDISKRAIFCRLLHSEQPFGLLFFLPFRYTRVLWHHTTASVRGEKPAHGRRRSHGKLLTCYLEGKLPYSHFSFTPP